MERMGVKPFVLTWVAIFAIACIAGCDEESDRKGHYSEPTLIGDLYDFCYSENRVCEDVDLNILLYLDHVNVPNPDYSYPYLVLTSVPDGAGTWDRLGFPYYEYDEIPPNVGFPVDWEKGWKARIPNARVEYCTTCYTDGGLAKIISLYGDRDQVEFIWDPEDTVGIYLDRRETE